MTENTTVLAGERWGKERRDDRDWVKYNEELVVRGTFYLDFDIFNDWEEELKKMNRNKRGGQYLFPESFIRWEVVWKQFLDYRGLEGVTRKIAQIGLIPRYNDYTTIWHRIHDLKPEIRLPKGKYFDVANDGTGLKTNNSGEYRREKYGGKGKKRLVVVITADKKKKKLIDVEVHIEGEGDSEPNIAKKHIRKMLVRRRKVRSYTADGAHDTHSMFDFLEDKGIKSSIKIRKTAVTECGLHGSKRRSREVKKYQRLGYKKWAEETGYGDRWPATEGIFSAVKRKFGENVVSAKKINVIAEAVQRFWAYDVLQMFGRGSLSLF